MEKTSQDSHRTNLNQIFHFNPLQLVFDTRALCPKQIDDQSNLQMRGKMLADGRFRSTLLSANVDDKKWRMSHQSMLNPVANYALEEATTLNCG